MQFQIKKKVKNNDSVSYVCIFFYYFFIIFGYLLHLRKIYDNKKMQFRFKKCEDNFSLVIK